MDNYETSICLHKVVGPGLQADLNEEESPFSVLINFYRSQRVQNKTSMLEENVFGTQNSFHNKFVSYEDMTDTLI